MVKMALSCYSVSVIPLFILHLWIVNLAIADEDYLVAFLDSGEMPMLNAASGDTGGWCYMESPRHGWKHTLQVSQYNQYLLSDNTVVTSSGIENKSVIVSTNGAVSIYINAGHGLYTPLPISALGTKYIVSSCHPVNYTSVLVIATHSQKADINITFRLEGRIQYGGRDFGEGDVLELTLDEYQTFTIYSDHDLSGTVIKSSETVGVYIGTASGALYLNRKHYVVTTEQLLPVKKYGEEYVIAVYDPQAAYQLQIVSEHSDTRITFNNGSSLSTGEALIYRTHVGKNGNLHFETTEPVMVTLCREWRQYSGFSVVPPVTFYGKQAALYLGPYTLKIITKKTTAVIARENSEVIVDVEWEDLPNTMYKVGTCRRAAFITCNDSLATLVLHSDYVHRAGYTGSLRRETTSQESDDETNVALILGLIIGLVILMLVFVIILLIFHLRKMKGKRSPTSEPNATNSVVESVNRTSTSSVDPRLPSVQQSDDRLPESGYSSLSGSSPAEHPYRGLGQNLM